MRSGVSAVNPSAHTGYWVPALGTPLLLSGVLLQLTQTGTGIVHRLRRLYRRTDPAGLAGA